MPSKEGERFSAQARHRWSKVSFILVSSNEDKALLKVIIFSLWLHEGVIYIPAEQTKHRYIIRCSIIEPLISNLKI